jgi:hypothetical protein
VADRESARVFRSTDRGRSWEVSETPVAAGTPLDRENHNSVGFAPTGEGWAVGPNGRITAFAKGD